MKHLFYTSSEAAWRGLLDAVRDAKQSIYMEMYIFVDDTGRRMDLIGALAAKAKHGVTVKIVLDGFGSARLSDEAIDALRGAGVELLFFRKLFRHLHRKIIIIDKKVGFIGGVNIHESARKWLDLLVRVEGKIIESFIGSFARVYRACGGTDPSLIAYRKRSIMPTAHIWLLEHLPMFRAPKLKDAYLKTLMQAKRSVTIITPYFLPHRWLKQALTKLAERGVTIDIIVPLQTDVDFITRANRRYMMLLSSEHIHFYLSPKMNHSKLLIVDNTTALVGSQNIDALSFDFNAEAGLIFDDPEMITSINTIVSNWKKDSIPFDATIHITWFDKIFSYFVRFMQPFL